MLNISVLICGLPRCIDDVIISFKNIFKQDKIDFYISTTVCSNIPNDMAIKKILLTNNNYDNKYRNSLNYFYRLCSGISILDNNYDLYIITRSDLIINNINLDLITDKNSLYFSDKNMNQFIDGINEKINDNIVITQRYENVLLLNKLYSYCNDHTNYSDIVLYKYINENKIKYELLNIDYKIILSKCNIIAVSGDSGSGKSTLVKTLQPIFSKEECLILETDRYHKWERGDKNYDKYTHLNPEANNLEKMYSDVYNLKLGNDIYQVDYDHKTGKFTNNQKIQSKKNVILCGLHTMYSTSINSVTNLKIFMDTDRDLIKQWKINRDITERQYNPNSVIKQIKDRENDYITFIETQKKNADIVISFSKISCSMTINQDIFYKISPYLIDNSYKIDLNNDKYIVTLKDSTLPINNTFVNNYHEQIFNIINKLFI